MTLRKTKHLERLERSAWTAAVVTQGFRHFRVVELRRGEAEWLCVLAATLDESKTVTLPARVLLRREGWLPGWQQLAG